MQVVAAQDESWLQVSSVKEFAPTIYNYIKTTYLYLL